MADPGQTAAPRAQANPGHCGHPRPGPPRAPQAGQLPGPQAGHPGQAAAGTGQTGSGPAEPERWLDPAEMAAWLAFLEVSHLLDRKIEQQLKQDAGLSHAQYEILSRLAATPGGQLRMSELADVIIVSRSGLTYQITQLEKAGLVRRAPCPSDERGDPGHPDPRGPRRPGPRRSRPPPGRPRVPDRRPDPSPARHPHQRPRHRPHPPPAGPHPRPFVIMT